MSSIAKTQNSDKIGDAERLFQLENYDAALTIYENLLKEDSSRLEYHQKAGLCYLYLNKSKKEAIRHLSKTIVNEAFLPESYYFLARAYHLNYEFDKAITYYKKIKELGFKDEEVETTIQYCENAKELMKFPLNVKFENLGENVNSKYSDFFPFLPKDESFLLYNTRRPEGSTVQKDGTYHSQVFISEAKDGGFEKGVPLNKSTEPVNVSEQTIGLSADGKEVFFFINLPELYGDIMYGKMRDKTVKEIQPLKTINTKFNEVAVSMSSDGKLIYFASDHKGGYGGVDLYISRKLQNGEWGVPQNLGPTINTKYDEDFPNISYDGKTLFFSSEGHTSMGGFDIFKSKWDEDSSKWKIPQNLGYPINTPANDQNYQQSPNGKYGYISAYREDGYGDFDIYRITYEDIESEFTVVKGSVYNSSTNKPIEKNVSIGIFDKLGKKDKGTYTPSPSTGKYVIILSPGIYEMTIMVEGEEKRKEELRIEGSSLFVPTIERSYLIKE